jgi:hypothetical protein
VLGWLKNLFVPPWTVQPCGCRFRESAFCPVEFKFCEPCEKEYREWLRKQPPRPPEPPDYNLYWCP